MLAYAAPMREAIPGAGQAGAELSIAESPRRPKQGDGGVKIWRRQRETILMGDGRKERSGGFRLRGGPPVHDSQDPPVGQVADEAAEQHRHVAPGEESGAEGLDRKSTRLNSSHVSE